MTRSRRVVAGNREDLLARIEARKSRSSSRSRSRARPARRPARGFPKRREARIRRAISRSRPSSRATQSVYTTPTKGARRSKLQNDSSGNSNPSWETIAKSVFLFGCLLFSLYLVSPPGVQPYAKEVFISDGHYGLNEADILVLLKDDPDYDENDHYGMIDILAPKNSNKMCAIFWGKSCRDWHFVQGAITILSILLVIWGLKTDFKRYRSGRKITRQNYQTYQSRSPGLLGVFGYYDTHVAISEQSTVLRRSPLAVKFGIIVICGIAGWACVNCLLAFDWKGFAVAGSIAVAAYFLAQVHIRSAWTKTNEI